MLHIYTDGGSRGNPGPSACGFVVLDDSGREVARGGKYIGVTTNNQAEYQGAILGLESIRDPASREVQLHMDSMLVVNQVKGVFDLKNNELWPAHERLMSLAGSFAGFSIRHVPREENTVADSIVNEVLDRGKG